MVDHRGRRDARLLRDGRDTGARVPVGTEQLYRGIDDLAASLDAALLNLPLDPDDGKRLAEPIRLNDRAGK
ncbi:hypothetical protein [Lentzea albida]|uniref:hypothetical protein n=1 Tax=Lentzea albida TaxID=65499 RepID=UPI002481D5C3|nr:hypothetical protein [Lentzea albida]